MRRFDRPKVTVDDQTRTMSLGFGIVATDSADAEVRAVNAIEAALSAALPDKTEAAIRIVETKPR
jgi:hypothetical protein